MIGAAVVAGPLAHTYGTGPVILVAAVVMALASFAPMLVRGSRELRRTASVAAPEPALAITGS